MNEQIRQLEDSIIDMLNESEVPIEAKRLIIKDIYRMVEIKANQIILEERSTDAEDIQQDKLAELSE